MIRAAIVGVSGYGRWHLLMAMEQALVGRLRLVGATIINPADEAVIGARLRRQGVPVFETFAEMLAALAGQVDVVLVPTGIHWHAAMTIAALQAGAHVLVEKPVAATLQDVDAIIAAEAASARLVAVGFQDLYVPAAHDIKRRVRAGEIGPLRRVTVCAQWPRSSEYYTRNAWAGRLRQDGAWVLDSPVSNALAHFVMLALFWSGDQLHTGAELVALEAELYRAHEIETFDTISLRARTASAVELLFYGTHAGREDLAPQIRLTGERGEIVWVYEKEYTVSRPGLPPEVVSVPRQLDTRLSVLEAVVGRLRGESPFIVSPALARGHTRLVNALHEFFPIHDIAPDQLELSEEKDGRFRRIRDLDAIIALAASRHALFSETGAPWAVRTGARSLAGYEAFGGCGMRLAAPLSA